MKFFALVTAFCSTALFAQDFPWTQTSAPVNQWQFVTSSSDGMKLMAVTYGRTNEIWTSTNGGVTWMQQIAAPTGTTPALIQWSCGASSSDGTKLFAGVGDGVAGGIYTSTNSGLTWTATGAPRQNWWGIASSSDGTKLVAGSGYGIHFGSGIFFSTNSGATWNRASTPSNGTYRVASSSDGTRLVAADNRGGIYASLDSGLTWARSDAPSNSWSDITISANGSNAVAIVSKGGIFTSLDCGLHWTQTSAPNQRWFRVASSSDGTKLAALTSNAGIWISINSGRTWTQSSEAPSQRWWSIASSSDGNRLVAASANRIYTDADIGLPPQAHLYRSCNMTQLRDGRWLQSGGFRSQGKSFVYDPRSRLWTDAGTMIHPRTGHTATLLPDGRVLVFGGVFLAAPSAPASAAEIYDPVRNQWQETGSPNIARGAYTMTFLSGGRLLLTGGLTNISPAAVVPTAEIFDPATGKWTLLAPMNEARYGHVAVVLNNGFVLVAGGKDKQANWIYTSELYDPANDRWTKTGSMPFESRYFYTGTLLTNGQVLLTATGGNYAWEVTNAWHFGKEIYDPPTGQWEAIGPHFVSSTNLDRTLTLSPTSGSSSFLASEEVELLVQSADQFGVTNIQLFCNEKEIGETNENPFRCTATNMAAGTYTFIARADYANGLASTSQPVTIHFTNSEPQVFIAPGPTEFISETRVKTSPATLLAGVLGVNPQGLRKLTLNGIPQPLQTGKFVLHPALKEGRNVFVLAAVDDHGRTGTATTEIYLNTIGPTVSISEPKDGASINAACVDVRGTFTGTEIKQIAVGGSSSTFATFEIPATITGNSFEARNVFLQPGTNTITAIIEDLAGNTNTTTLAIIGPADDKTAHTLPVQIHATPSAGFAPLTVGFSIEAHVPGKTEKVFFDFDGDGAHEQVTTGLKSFTHIYKTAGQYFPVATIQTSVGRFSSLSGMFAMIAAAFGERGPMLVNVQAPPTVLSTIKITDPVDVKWTANSNLYVLSGSTATISEFDSQGRMIRSKTQIGSNPSGFAVDAAGNVYVAVTGNNQIWKFKPTSDSFEADVSFGSGGFIGNKDGSAGSKAGQFNAPYDVVLSRDGATLTVSDSGNRRVLQFNLSRMAAPPSETSVPELKDPQGLATDENWLYLFIVDSESGRIFLSEMGFSSGSSGTNGAALGQFNRATHLAANGRALYVADTGNNRIQVFNHVEGGEMHSPVPFEPRLALSSELGLNHPRSVAAVEDSLKEKLYIADTGNNRVLLVNLPLDNPEAIWKNLVDRLNAGDVDGALSCFSLESKDKYRQAFLTLSKDELRSSAKGMEKIKPASIETDQAQYYFENVIEGKTITFPVQFAREFGQWKVVEY